MARIVIAGDFGGTNLRAALVTETGEILVRHEVSTTPDASPDGALEGIGDLLMKVRDYGSELPVAASLAVAGLIDGENILLSHLIGAAIILCGVYLVNKTKIN